MIPHGGGEVQIQKPAEEPVVMIGFDQQRFRADREEGWGQASGRNRGPAQFGRHRVGGRESREGLVGQRFDLAQRMIRRHETFRRNQTQPVRLRVEASTHGSQTYQLRVCSIHLGLFQRAGNVCREFDLAVTDCHLTVKIT